MQLTQGFFLQSGVAVAGVPERRSDRYSAFPELYLRAALDALIRSSALHSELSHAGSYPTGSTFDFWLPLPHACDDGHKQRANLECAQVPLTAMPHRLTRSYSGSSLNRLPLERAQRMDGTQRNTGRPAGQLCPARQLYPPVLETRF